MRNTVMFWTARDNVPRFGMLYRNLIIDDSKLEITVVNRGFINSELQVEDFYIRSHR